jgi:outer membrane receptor protein involved in Fe transport
VVANIQVARLVQSADHRAFLSVALFNADYKNLQAASSGINVGRPDLGTLIITQGNSKARGFELEGSVRLLEGLTLGGSIGYTDITFGPVNPILLAEEGGVFNPTLVPKWTSDIYAEYDTAPVYKDAFIVLRTNTAWRSKEPTLANPAYERLPGFGPVTQSDPAAIVNASVSLRDIPLWKTKASDNGVGSQSYQRQRRAVPAGFYQFSGIVRLSGGAHLWHRSVRRLLGAGQSLTLPTAG